MSKWKIGATAVNLAVLAFLVAATVRVGTTPTLVASGAIWAVGAGITLAWWLHDLDRRDAR